MMTRSEASIRAPPAWRRWLWGVSELGGRLEDDDTEIARDTIQAIPGNTPRYCGVAGWNL